MLLFRDKKEGNMRENWKRLARWIDTKRLAFIAGILFIITMLPNWGLAFIARPAGDDYGYSAATRQVWLESHSIIEALKTGLETTKTMCNVWNGDWFSVFIFTLMPEAFVYGSFWIVPVFWSLAMIGATVYFMHQLLVRMWGIKWYESLTIAVLVLLMSYQWVPSSGIALYWYVGVIHYIMPHVVALFLLGFLIRFLQTEEKKYIVLSAFGMVAIGGSSYYSVFLVLLTYVLIFACEVWKEKKVWWMSLPTIAGLVALYFQIKAPGNAARVGDTLGFSVGKAIDTVLGALAQGIVIIGQYMKEKPWIFLILLLAAILLWMSLIETESNFVFRYPLLFVGYMYGIYASMFTPEIYAATEISGGPPTMEYLTFLLTAVISIGYVEGWLIKRLREKNKLCNRPWYYIYILMLYSVFMCICILISKGEIKETLFYESMEYIVSGAASDYKEQMDQQEKILLDDSIKEAYLCPTNDQQGPLMHMPVISDPNAFTNRVIKEFYGKEYVVAEP